MDGVRPTFVFVAIAAFAMAGCAGGDQGAIAGGSSRQQRLDRASQGLCDALVAASEGRVEEAAEVFDRETHDFLHELAGALSEEHRAVAASLLRAKQRVEAAFEDPVRGDPPVADLLGQLQGALGEAADAAGLGPPLCREEAA